MKRLIRADYYSDDENNETIEDKLKEAVIYFCDQLGVEKNTVKTYINGSKYTVEFGDVEEYGYTLSISVYSDNSIDRIILNAGKNSAGKAIYIETRDQNILDQFMGKENGFYNWYDQEIGNIEKMM